MNIKTTVDREKVLAILKTNREEHAEIVAEAREGYVEQARKALEKRLGQIKEGKVVNLTFSLNPPQDHTEDYDTVIKMLEMHVEKTVTLDSQQFRQYVEDNWNWKSGFIVGSARYSQKANEILNG